MTSITNTNKPSDLKIAEEYRNFNSEKKNLVDLLAMPGIENIDFEPPKLDIMLRLPEFD